MKVQRPRRATPIQHAIKPPSTAVLPLSCVLLLMLSARTRSWNDDCFPDCLATSRACAAVVNFNNDRTTFFNKGSIYPHVANSQMSLHLVRGGRESSANSENVFLTPARPTSFKRSLGKAYGFCYACGAAREAVRKKTPAM